MVEGRVVLGVDPGFKVTGYGVLGQGAQGVFVLDFGVIDLSKIKERVHATLFDSLEELINKYAPHAIAVEGQFLYRNPRAFMKIALAKGLVLLAGEKAFVPVYEYAPRLVKEMVTGQGNASKECVQRQISTRLKLPQVLKSPDVADALALAFCHISHVPCLHV